MSSPLVVIVGGGITGLSAAYYVERLALQAGIDVGITLVESSSDVGGKTGTESAQGFLVDTGPDSFLGQKPWAVELCEDLGIADEVMRPSARKFYMLHDGHLHSVPHELVTLVPSKPEALWKASFLSMQAKTRASMEGLIPAQHDVEDESLSAFMRRRFGAEFALRFAEPLMGGVHAGHPERMSMRAIYPMYWDMEQKKGSITRAIMERRAAAALHGGQPPQSPFVALKHGMSRLISAVRSALRTTNVLTGRRVVSLGSGASQVLRVVLDDGTELPASEVVLAIPAFDAACLVRPHASQAADLLDAIPYASTAVVSLAYDEGCIGNPLDGSGFLVPRGEETVITGCTWSHRKWEGRAPAGMALMRAFIGYAGADEVVVNSSEDELAQMAHADLARLLGITGEPAFVRVHRWLRAMPQYEVGHLARLDAISAEMTDLPGVILAGSAYRGVGVPDCVRQGKEAAGQVLAHIESHRA